jgi:MSHA biogenesis protein MshJ
MSELKQYVQKYEALAPREKMLLLLMAVTIVYLLLNLLVLASLDETEAKLLSESQALKAETSELTMLMVQYTVKLNTDPDAVKKNKIKALRWQMDKLDYSLSAASLGLVTSDQLSVLLQDVLSNRGKLSLVSLKTLPIEKINVDDDQQQEPTEQGLVDESVVEPLGVYKHGVEIVFTGSYFDVQDYLASLEALSWRFYWDYVNYRVDAYPKGQVTLKVYTLSTEEGVFGV